MKDVKQLQLGDWVNAEGKKTPVQITSLANDGSIEVNDDYYCTVEDLSSIWLLDGLMNKNFQKVHNEWRVDDRLRIIINPVEGKNWLLIMRTEECGYPLQFVPVCAFNFVHELQHALRMFGIDKEVVL